MDGDEDEVRSQLKIDLDNGILTSVEKLLVKRTGKSPRSPRVPKSPRGNKSPRRKVKKKKLIKRRKKRSSSLPLGAPPKPLADYSSDQIHAACVIQRWWRRLQWITSVERILILNRKRKAILREIAQTEKSYVYGLQQIKREYLTPLARILSPVEISGIFPGINDIWKLHERLLKDLGDLMASGNVTNRTAIAELFSKVSTEFTRIYSPFLNAAERAPDILQNIMEQNSQVQEVVSKVKSKNGLVGGVYYYNELLITPMQRLPRYKLLFSALLKVTSDLFPDYVPLEKALENIEEAVQVVNDMKRESDEHFRKMFLLEHGSMQVLRRHEWGEPKGMKSIRFCSHCSKSIWGVSKKYLKCSVCKEKFHIKCADMIGNMKTCRVRRRLNLANKVLSYTQEVYLLPEDQQEAINKSIGSPQPKKMAETMKSGSFNSPSARRKGGEQKQPKSSLMRLRQQNAAQSMKTLRSSASSHNVGAGSIKALLCFFDDGLGICHLWEFSDKEKPMVDMIGELPWKVINTVETSGKHANGLAVFSIVASQITWRFGMKNMIEADAFVKKLNNARKEAMERRRKRKEEFKISKEKSRQSLLQRSGPQSISSSSLAALLEKKQHPGSHAGFVE